MSVIYDQTAAVVAEEHKSDCNSALLGSIPTRSKEFLSIDIFISSRWYQDKILNRQYLENSAKFLKELLYAGYSFE